MRREVLALRLRNMMDPKRFYRGGSSSAAHAKSMPAHAQIGTILPSALEPARVLARSQRGRSIVEELVRDADAGAYARKKFDEVGAMRARRAQFC